MLELVLHYTSFSLMVIIICLCCMLMVFTKDTQNLSALASLKENILIYILCIGGIFQALNIAPIYYARYPFWRDFRHHILAPWILRLVCSLQMCLFHLGFCLFHSALLLGVYRMTMRINKNVFSSKIGFQVFLVVCLPTMALIAYFIVWFVFYQHPPESCLTSRHHDYLFIVENAVLLAILFLIIPIHQVYPRKDSRSVYVALVVSFVLGTVLYFLRLCTETVWPGELETLLAELHVWAYVFIVVVANIKWKLEMGQSDTRESMSFGRKESTRRESISNRDLLRKESVSKRESFLRKQGDRVSVPPTEKKMSFSLIRRISRRVSPPSKDLEKGKLKIPEQEENQDAVYELSLATESPETNEQRLSRKRGDIEWYKDHQNEHNRWY